MDNMRQLPKISFHDISPFEYREIMSFLMQHYYPEEILTVSIQPKEPTTPDIEFTMEAIQEGYSVKAIITCEDEDGDGGEEIINDKVGEHSYRTTLVFVSYIHNIYLFLICTTNTNLNISDIGPLYPNHVLWISNQYLTIVTKNICLCGFFVYILSFFNNDQNNVF